MIKYSKQADKYLDLVPKALALRIHRAIDLLPTGDVKRMQGVSDPAIYRLRVGGYRVLFTSDGEVIKILRIDTRRRRLQAA